MKYVFGEIYHMQMERDALPPAHIQPLEGGGGGGDFKRALNYAITTFSFSPPPSTTTWSAPPQKGRCLANDLAAHFRLLQFFHF
jgi:hypothetical protein